MVNIHSTNPRHVLSQQLQRSAQLRLGVHAIVEPTRVREVVRAKIAKGGTHGVASLTLPVWICGVNPSVNSVDYVVAVIVNVMVRAARVVEPEALGLAFD